jgi:hypothetical protein
MALTHLSIINAKSQAISYKLTDSDSLCFVVQPNGSKLWRMNYRHLDCLRTLHLGSWPEVSHASPGKSEEQFADCWPQVWFQRRKRGP